MARKFKLGPVQKAWIQSLKENPERQIQRRLGVKHQDGSYSACCLGEGGLIAGVCRWDGPRLVDIQLNNEQSLDGTTFAALGLRSPTGRAKDEPYAGQSFTYSDDGRRHIIGFPSLADMNDASADTFDWPHIAVILETFPEVYFKKSV